MDQFNEFRFLAASCPATTFPIILGGTNAETAFTAFDDDNVGNIGIGGYTYDSGLLGTPLNEMQPIIAMITPASTYLWSKAIYQVGYMVLSLDGVLGVAITGDTSADGNFAYFGGYLFQGSIEQAHIQRADYTKYNVNTDTLTSDYSINLPTEITTVTQIRGIDSQSVELLYQDASGLGFKLMKINFQTLACSVQAITIFASNTNNIYSSKYLSNQGGYVFVGGYDNFGGGPTGIADQTFSQKIGAILTFQSSYRCLGSQETNEVPDQKITIDLNLASIQSMAGTASYYSFSYSSVAFNVIASNSVSLVTCGTVNAYTFSTQSTLTGTYMIGNSQTFTMTPYTIDCDLATLTQEIKFESSLSNSIFGTSTIYSIDNINYQFTLNTADTTYDGYTIIFSLTATVQETWQTASYNYEILIQQYTCDKVVITAQTIPDLTYFLSYGDGYVIADIQWPQTYEALCPYSSQILVTKIEDGLTYQTIQKIDISNPTHFQFTSNGLNSIGNYRVDINIYVSSLNDYTTNSGLKSRNIYSDTFMVQVTEECNVNQIFAVAQTSTINVKLKDTYQYELPEWINQYSICNNIVYLATPLPSFITFDSVSRIFNIEPIQESDIGIHNILIQGRDTVSGSKSQTNYAFTVIQSYSDLPFFSYLNLKDMKLENSIQTQVYLFKTQALALKFFQNFDLAIDLGEASEFAKFENFNLKFNPTQRNELKSYEIQYSVTSLSDNLSYIGVLKVDVGIYFRGNQTNLPSENIDVGSEGSVNNPRVKRIITARIISMSFRGIATIRFNDTLALNRDVSKIDFQKHLTIEIQDGLREVVDQKLQNVTHFYAISFDGIDLKLQLEFSYPEGVSQSSIQDVLKVTFTRNDLFVNVIRDARIPFNYTIERRIGQQFYNSTPMVILDKATKTSVNTIFYAIAINLFLQLAFRFSMKMLWRMMNILQLIVNLPLMGFNLPSNVVLCFTQLVGITSLQFVDKDTVKSHFFNYVSETDESILVNVGYIFIGLFILVLLGILMFLCKRLSDKYDLVKEILLKLHRKVFFSSVIRYFSQSYLTFSISACISLQYLSSGKESNDYEMTISGLVLIVMFMMPFSTYAFLLMNEERLFERSFKKRFGSLYLGMRQQCPHLILNASMFYMKRLIYGLSVVFLLDLDIIQILFNLIIALGTLTTQIHYKPLDSRQGNNFEIFNELQYFTILTLILVLVGDIITDIEMRYTIGWIIVMMVINFIILNWGYLFVLMAFSIVKYSKIYYRRFLMMRAMKRKVKKMFDYQLQNQFESTLILNQLKKKQEQIPAVDIQVMEFSQSKPSNEIEQVDEVSLTLEEENDLNEQEMIAKTASGHFDQRQNSLSPSQLSMTPRNPNSIGTQFRKSQSPQQMTSLKYQKARSHRLSNKKLTDSTKNFMKQESLPISEKPISMQNGIFVSSKTQAKSKQFGISLVQNHMQRNNYIDTLGSDDQLTGRHKNQEEEKMSYQHQFSYFSKASNGSNNVSPGLPHRQPSILMSSQVNLAPVFRDEKKTDENRLDELKKRLAKYNLEKV